MERKRREENKRSFGYHCETWRVSCLRTTVRGHGAPGILVATHPPSLVGFERIQWGVGEEGGRNYFDVLVRRGQRWVAEESSGACIKVLRLCDRSRVHIVFCNASPPLPFCRSAAAAGACFCVHLLQLLAVFCSLLPLPHPHKVRLGQQRWVAFH